MERDKEWRNDIRVAKELHYKDIVINKLKNEPDPSKRYRILCNANHGLYD